METIGHCALTVSEGIWEEIVVRPREPYCFPRNSVSRSTPAHRIFYYVDVNQSSLPGANFYRSGRGFHLLSLTCQFGSLHFRLTMSGFRGG